ncbi:unnamed protein product [Calypogeia fissa]
MSTTKSIRLLQRNANSQPYEVVGIVEHEEGETLAGFRNLILEVVEFDFVFWDDRIPGRVRPSLEKLTKLSSLDGKVVVCRADCDQTPCMPIAISSRGSVATVTTTNQVGVDAGEATISPTPVPVIASFESVRMTEAVQKQWEKGFKKIESWAKDQGLGDNSWKLRTWDQGTVPCAQIFCNECMAPSGKATNCQDSKAIDNAWSNFRKHLKNEKHSDNYAKLRGLPTGVARVKTVVVKETIDHAKLIVVGVEIVQKLNDESGGGVFYVQYHSPYRNPRVF